MPSLVGWCKGDGLPRDGQHGEAEDGNCSPKTRCTSAMMDDPSDIAIMLCWHISNTTAHVKRLSKRHGKLILVPENQQRPPLAITETTAFEV
jgi:hypothetical protein